MWYCFHFIDVENEVQRGKAMCPRTHCEFSWRQIVILDHLASEDTALLAGLKLLPGYETLSFFNCTFLTTSPPLDWTGLNYRHPYVLGASVQHPL